MSKISAVIITFNEERNIDRCLCSLSGIADEIVVVDSFSNDRTEEICRKHGVVFIQAEWKGYSETKNFANSKAKFDYILSLDADECLSEQLKQEILSLKEGVIADAYEMPRRTNYCGYWINYTDWNPDIKLRLWNKNRGQWNGAIVHEKVDIKGKTCRLKGAILHYTFYTIEEHIAQSNRFTTLMAKSRFDNNKRAGFVKLVLSPGWKFFRSYIIKLGILDGFAGFAIASISAYSTFITYAKLRQLYRKQ